MNKEINMKKDPAVELARIFGCLLVVGVHCWINILVWLFRAKVEHI